MLKIPRTVKHDKYKQCADRKTNYTEDGPWIYQACSRIITGLPGANLIPLAPIKLEFLTFSKTFLKRYNVHITTAPY